MANIISKVQGFSKTRGSNENLTVKLQDTYAEVRSASGKKYIVTRESCTCQDHFFRGHDRHDEDGRLISRGTVCRHRKALYETLNQMRTDVRYW